MKAIEIWRKIVTVVGFIGILIFLYFQIFSYKPTTMKYFYVLNNTNNTCVEDKEHTCVKKTSVSRIATLDDIDTYVKIKKPFTGKGYKLGNRR